MPKTASDAMFVATKHTTTPTTKERRKAAKQLRLLRGAEGGVAVGVATVALLGLEGVA